eukprot:g2945.t1
MDILELTQTVYLNTSKIGIRGKGMNETTIYCAMNGDRKEAFIINGNLIRVESLTLSGCNDGSAVVIDGNQSRRNNSLEVYFDRVSFINNGRIHDSVSGGAINIHTCLEDSCITPVVNIQQCIFLENKAKAGGAIFGQNCKLRISNSTFIRNEADVAGGAVGSHNGHLVVNGSSFIGNKARLGAGLFIIDDTVLEVGIDKLTGRPTIFEGNKAVNGAGILAVTRCSIMLKGVQFQNNQALRKGGALRVYDTTHPIVIHGVQFVNNTALIGGAIGADAVANFEMDAFNGVPTRILNNVAAVGGGLLRTPGTLVYETLYIRNTEFKDNKALSLSDPLVQIIEQSALDDPYFRRIISETRRRFPEEYSLEAVFAQLSSFPEGYGGGFLIETADLGAYTIAEVLFENITMTGNEARVGGAGYLSGHVAFWNARLLFQNVSISRNQAQYAGGLFVSKPETVMLTCNMNVAGRNTTLLKAMQMRHQGQNHSTSFKDSYCTEIHSNLISDGESIEGADVSSSVTSLHLVNFTQTLRTVASGERITMPCEYEDDSECQRYLTVAIKDAFNQTIHHGTEDANLDLTLSSSSVIGDLRYTATNGTVKINNTSAWGINITSAELTIQATANPSMKVTVNFTTRPCIIGEHIHESLCSPCPPDQYGFDPLQNSCAPCEEHAICKGKTVLVPIDGYWHSTPFSSQFHPCIYPEACTFDDRTENLVSFHEDWTQLQRLLSELELYNIGKVELPDFSIYQQCAHGYEGVLCGSCAKNYGRSLTGECARCPGKGDSVTLRVFFFLWLFLIVGINAMFTLFSAQERIRLLKYELWKQNNERKKSGLSRTQEHIRVQNGSENQPESSREEDASENRPESSREEDASENRPESSRVQHASEIRPESSRVQHASEIRPESSRVQHASEIRPESSRVQHASEIRLEFSPEEDEPVDVTVPSRNLSCETVAAIGYLIEIFKILLNYLQVTSIALRLQVGWKSAMTGLLSTEATLSGITSDVFNSPFECHFDGSGSHSSIAALWLRIFTPTFVLCALILFFSIIWLFMRYKFWTGNHPASHSDSEVRFWKTGVIVITIVAIYFSFIDVVRELLRSVNCVKVDEIVDSNLLYKDYSIATNGKAWVEDTSLTCFEGKHTGTGISGIVGLFIAFSIIVSLVLWLPFNRKNMEDEEFIARYWFLYQSYKKEWYAFGWEAVILTRKALMAAVIVFAVHLGRNLQATLCVSILLIALMIQSIFRPFKVNEDAIAVPEYFGGFFDFINLPGLKQKWKDFNKAMNLNDLESASLFASITVFVSALVLNDSHSSRFGEIVVTTTTFLINVLYLIFMLYRLYTGLHRVLDLKLQCMDEDYMDRNSNSPGVAMLFRKGYQIVSFYYKEHNIKDQQSVDKV